MTASALSWKRRASTRLSLSRASRYGKSIEGSADGAGDYLNCPFDRQQYERFLDALLSGESVTAHIEEDRTLHTSRSLPPH